MTVNRQGYPTLDVILVWHASGPLRNLNITTFAVF
jgi:hypothetical protein